MTNKSITERYGEGLLDLSETTEEVYNGLPINELPSMYGTKSTSTPKKASTLTDQISLSASSGNSYLIEVPGQKIHVPTMAAYQKLVEDHISLKADHARLFQEGRRLFSVVKKLKSMVDNIDEELAQKVDKYDTDTGL